MRLVKDRILHVWEQRRAEAKDRTSEQEKRVKVIEQKLDRLDEAFLFAQSIDATSPNPWIAPDRVSPYTRSSSVERTILDFRHDHRRDQ